MKPKDREEKSEQEHLFSLPIEKSYEEDGDWIVEGVVSTSEVDSENFRMTKPALEDLVRDSKILSTVLHNHLKDEEIGVIQDAKVIRVQKDPEIWGAWVKILISKTVPKIWQKIREKVLSKFSIKGMAEAREIRDKLAGVITEAIGYKGAEISIVSVPTLQTARILAHYVSKMKDGGFPMEAKDLEKVTMEAAKAAIKDRLGLDDEKWEEVSNILDLVEQEVKKDETEVEKAAGSLSKVLTGLKALKEKVPEDTQKIVDDLITAVEGVIEEGYPKPTEKSEEEIAAEAAEKAKKKKEDKEEDEVEKAKKDEAAKKKVEDEEEEKKKKEESVKKSKEIADALTASLTGQLDGLSVEAKAVFAPILSTLEALSTPVEKGKGTGTEKKKDDETQGNAIETISKSLIEVEKSIKDASNRIQSDQVVQMAEQVVALQGEVTKLTEIMKTQVPIRKGLIKDGDRRPAENKPFTEDENYKELAPRQKLSYLFGKMEE